MRRERLELLKKTFGVKSSTEDEALSLSLASATSWVNDRVYPWSRNHPEVVQATLMMAWRLHKRRLSPEGVAGWDDMGQIRIIARDPDIDRLLEQHIDAGRVMGIA